MKTFMKAFLLVAICLTLTSVGIYKYQVKDRFNISPDGSMFSDTKTSDVYILTASENAQKFKWLKFDKSGHATVVRELPR